MSSVYKPTAPMGIKRPAERSEGGIVRCLHRSAFEGPRTPMDLFVVIQGGPGKKLEDSYNVSVVLHVGSSGLFMRLSRSQFSRTSPARV